MAANDATAALATGQDVVGAMVVGAGNVSKSYLEFFAAGKNGTRLVAVAEPFEAARQTAARSYKPTVLVSDYREVLERDDIDLAVVCTPHDSHHAIVIDCLQAGKHVICEKPLSITVKEADEMLATAKACGRRLFTNLNMRFLNENYGIKRLVSQNKLGKPFMGYAAYFGYEVERLRAPNNWKGDKVKAGGGVLLDGGYHVVDLMNWFFGRAKFVQAMGGQFVINVPHKGEDNILVQVEYESGAIATLQVSFTICHTGCHKEPTLILEIDLFGTEGSIYGGINYDTIKLHRHLDLVTPSEGKQAIDIAEHEPPEVVPHFLKCIAEGTEPIATALDARNATAVVQAAYESIRTGQRVAVDWRSA